MRKNKTERLRRVWKKKCNGWKHFSTVSIVSGTAKLLLASMSNKPPAVADGKLRWCQLQKSSYNLRSRHFPSVLGELLPDLLQPLLFVSGHLPSDCSFLALSCPFIFSADQLTCHQKTFFYSLFHFLVFILPQFFGTDSMFTCSWYNDLQNGVRSRLTIEALECTLCTLWGKLHSGDDYGTLNKGL